jgi:hypothetical protein
MIEAIHEAGHAFAFTHFGVEVEYATLIVSDEFDGNTSEWGGYTSTPAHVASVLQEAVCIMAGPIAGSIETGKDFGRESEGDFQHLTELFDQHKIPHDYRAKLRFRASVKSQKLISANWETVLKIARVLEEKKRIEGWEIKKIVEDASMFPEEARKAD